MKLFLSLSFVLLAGASFADTGPSTVSSHFFPRLQPLFAGLDEARVPMKSRSALAEAKIDFERARHDDAPQFAKFVGNVPHTNSRIYQGRGYTITVKHVEWIEEHADGPEIVLASSLTGGAPYRYDEVDEVTD